MEYFENNFTVDWLAVYAEADDMGDVVQRKYPPPKKKLGRNRGGVLSTAQHKNIKYL